MTIVPVLLICTGVSAIAATNVFDLVKANKYDEARKVLEDNSAKPYQKHHLNGIIAKHQNDLQSAVELFRKALELNPNFKASRRELAHSLFLLKEYDASKIHFETLVANTNSEQEENSYKRFLKAIKSKRPFGLTAFFGFLPSSNANKGSAHETFDNNLGTLKIDEASRAQSGVGFNAGLSAFYRYDIDESYQLLFSGSLNARVYENTQSNSVSTTLNFEVGKRFENGSLFIGPTITSSFTQDEDATPLIDLNSSVVRTGVKVRGNYRFNRKTNLGFQASSQRQDFKGKEYRNGHLHAGSISLSRSLSPTLSTNIRLGVTRETAEIENLQHTDYRGSFGFSKKWKTGFITSLNLSYETHRYDENFTGLNEARRDNKMGASISIVNPNLEYNGFAPKFTYSYTRQNSNVSFYDYDSHDVGLTLTKDF